MAEKVKEKCRREKELEIENKRLRECMKGKDEEINELKESGHQKDQLIEKQKKAMKLYIAKTS